MTHRCDEVELHMASWVAGELRPAEAGRLEIHLDACAACRDLAAELRANREVVGGLGDFGIERDALAALRLGVMSRIEAAPARSGLWWPMVVGTVGVVGLLFMGAWLMRPGARTSPPPEVAQAPAQPEKTAAPPAASTETPPPTDTVVREARRPTSRRRPGELRPAEDRAAAEAPERAASRPVVETAEKETPPLVIRLATSDPDIVIYWIVEKGGES